MDTVFVHDLSLRGKHGVGEEERGIEQEFLVDIEASYDSTKPALTDALDDTVDYVHFVDVARRHVEKNSFYLIEKLADSIAKEILQDPRIKSVRVSIKKPAVFTSGVPGVVIERKRV